MKQSLLIFACALATLSASTFSQAATKDGDLDLTSVAPSGACLPIPDNTYRGNINTAGQAVCKAFTVPGAGAVNNLSLQLGLTHTWVGDLVIKVQNPARTKTVTLMSRAGAVEVADDGISAGGAGDSSNLLNTFPVSFADSFATSAESMGSVPTTLGTADVVCRDQASPCNYQPNPGAAVAGNLATFNGDPVGAGWQICIGDRAAADIGDLCAVTPSNGGGPVPTVNYTTPTTLTFPSTVLGANTSANVPVATAAANTAALQLSQCTLAGANAGDFSVTAPVGATTVAAGTTTNVVVRFAPINANPASRVATLTCPTPNATPANATSFSVALSGVAGTIIVASAPVAGPINFGELLTGLSGAPAQRNVIFTNSGTLAGTVSCSTSGTGFSVAPVTPQPIAPLTGSTTFTVTANTATPGAITGTLSCTTQGTTTSFVYALSGFVGTPGFAQIVPGPINFGSLTVGLGLPSSVVFRNTGTITAALTCVTTGVGFSVTPSGVQSIAPNGSATFTVLAVGSTAGQQLTGTLSCSAPGIAAPFVFALNGSTSPVTNIPTLSSLGLYLMGALMLGFGMVLVGRQRV